MAMHVRRGTRIRDGRPIGVCDRCSAVVPKDQLKTEWTGLIVCTGNANGAHNCWEPKHPFLDFQVPIDDSLYQPDPRNPRDDFVKPAPTFQETLAVIRKGQRGGTI